MDFKSDKNLINADMLPLINYQEQQQRMDQMRKNDIKHLKRGAYNFFIIGLAVYVAWKLYEGLAMRGALPWNN